MVLVVVVAVVVVRQRPVEGDSAPVGSRRGPERLRRAAPSGAEVVRDGGCKEKPKHLVKCT